MSKEHSPATLDVSPHGELIKKLLAYIPVEGQAGIAVRDALMKEAANAIAALHERLEDSYYFDWEGNRVECAPGSIPDGISCRDETIKLQDQAIDKFLSARSETRLMPGQNIGNPGTLPPASYGQNAREDAGKIEDTRSAIRLFPMRRVVCAAIRNSTQDIICGPRHFDIHMRRQIAASQFIGWDVAEQGFVDQQGIFLTRDQAHPIAKEAGQIIRRCGGDESTLYSENLY